MKQFWKGHHNEPLQVQQIRVGRQVFFAEFFFRFFLKKNFVLGEVKMVFFKDRCVLTVSCDYNQRLFLSH